MSNYRQTKKWAWEYYKKWMKEKTYCKIMDEEIRISRKAWDHLVSRRTIRDKHSRMMLLKPAKHLLKNAKEYSTKQKNGVEYTEIKGEVKLNNRKCNIKLLLKKDLKGKYYLFSIMKA